MTCRCDIYTIDNFGPSREVNSHFLHPAFSIALLCHVATICYSINGDLELATLSQGGVKLLYSIKSAIGSALFTVVQTKTYSF
jgi:hypothetical protein